MPNIKVSFQNISSSHVKDCFTKALSAYEPLHDHPLILRKMSSSAYTMRAQPVINWNIGNKNKRAFRVDVSNHAKLEAYIRIADLPEEVLIGWFAHELGHVMDYYHRSLSGLIKFGLGYVLLPTYRLGAERQADLFAIEYGMADYLLATKQYILHHSNLPEKYLNRIKKYYMSPEEVGMIIEAQEEIAQSS